MDGASLKLSEESAKAYIKEQLKLIENYTYLIDSFLAEFFVNNLWAKFPASWQKCLEKLPLDEFFTLVSLERNRKYSLVLPLSLQAYAAACHHLALPRNKLTKETKGSKNDIPNGGHMEHNFRRHVKLKKQYEVRHLSQLIKGIADEVDCSQTVDVGGGLGHLSRYLALVHKFKVTTIESEGHHKSRAEQYDKEIIKDLEKTKTKGDAFDRVKEDHTLPVHITKMVPLDIKPGEFIRLVRTSSLEDNFDVTASSFCDVAVPSADHKTSDNENSSKQRDAFILVGLHTCGDLSSTLLRTFVNCPEVKGMALVGCCYMKLTCDSVEASYDSVEASYDSVEASYDSVEASYDDNCSDHLFIASDDSKERSSCSLDTVERRLFSDGIISVGSNCRNRITCKEFKNCAVANCSYDSCDSGDTGSLNAKLCHVNDIDSLQQISNCSINFGCQLPDSYAEMSNGSDDKCKNPHVKDHCSGGNDWNTNLIGFPMSHFLQIQGRPFIGWDAFELACHNLDNYLLRLRDDESKLKIQSYRSILEVVIRRLKPEVKTPQIRCQRIKGSSTMTFQQYADSALNRIHFPKPSLHLYEEINIDALLSRWKEVIMFYCLRLLLGPVIESLILLDRCLYLRENGYAAHLCPVFDAKISPRNFAIVAKKSKVTHAF